MKGCDVIKKIRNWIKRNGAEILIIMAFLIFIGTTAALNIYLAGYLSGVLFFLEGISIAMNKKGGGD
ncbi:MAG: hypothetical protein RSD63_10580 [Eubacterium sp.]